MNKIKSKLEIQCPVMLFKKVKLQVGIKDRKDFLYR